MQVQLAKGWNTWNTRSVLSQVMLPEGFAINVCLKEYRAGRYLKESLIGRFQPKTDPGLDYRGGELVEIVTPAEHAYDGSYTKLKISWRGIEAIVQTATTGDDLVILVTPLKNQKYPATVVFESAILWNREGTVEKDGEVIVAKLPRKEIRVFGTESWVVDPYIPAQTPYAAMTLRGELGVSTGQRRSVVEIKSIIDQRRLEHKRRREKYGTLSDTYDAMQSCLAWATIYEPKKSRVITTLSRAWDIDRNFGGYLLAQDNFYHGYIASLDNKELAYANVVGMIKETVPAGFVPFAATGGGYTSFDKCCPPIASIMIKDFYRRFHDRWVLEETFDDLLSWNRWRFHNRQIAAGLLAWGSNPYEPIYDNHFELNFVNVLWGAKLESGMDNSPMWDDVAFNKQKHMMEYADVGLTSLYIADCDALADIADVIGKKPEALELRERGQECKKGLKTLWDDSTGMYLNRHTDTGKLSNRLSPSNFYPLLTDVPTKAQAERMIREHFYNPNEFWGEWIMPCSPRNDSGYRDQNYWRGRIWGPTNFWVYLGLRNYGMKAAEKDLAEKSKNLLLKEWLEFGHVHENYNANLGIGCDDPTESEKFYTWSGLFGLLSLIEAGYFD